MLTLKEAREYLLLQADKAIALRTPLPSDYTGRAAVEQRCANITKRMNALIRKAGAKNLTDMDRIVAKAIAAPSKKRRGK